jgi:hypothetical protein
MTTFDGPIINKAYRSVVCDRLCLDATIEKAAQRAGMRDVRQRFSPETDIIMWIDPGNVTVR